MTIYKLKSADIQKSYDDLKELANSCRDDDGELKFADSYVSVCDLGQEYRKTVSISLFDPNGKNVLTIKSDEMLKSIYKQLRSKDEKDGSLDGNILNVNDNDIDIEIGEKKQMTEAFLDKLQKSVLSTSLTMANGENSKGSAFIVKKETVKSGGSKKYKYFAYTCAHVVDDPFKEESTFYVSSKEISAGKPIKADIIQVDHKKDFAIISFESEVEISEVTLGDSDKIEKTDQIYTIGNRLTGGITATAGTIVIKKALAGGSYVGPAIKIDDSGAPGNSGGPVINLKGEVIGIIFQGETSSGSGNNLSYAVPINDAKFSAEKIMTYKKAIYPNLGYESKMLPYEVRDTLGLESGVYLSYIYPNSSGHKAGLKSGDVLLEVDGKDDLLKIGYAADLYLLDEYIMDKIVGDEINLKILRDGEKIDISVTLDESSSGIVEAWNTPYNFTAVALTSNGLNKSGLTGKAPFDKLTGVVIGISNQYETYTEYGLPKLSIITHVIYSKDQAPKFIKIMDVKHFKEVLKNIPEGAENIVFKYVVTEQSPTKTGSVGYVSVPK